MRRLGAILSATYLLFSVQAAVADKRVAFVVGNGAYKYAAQQPNAPVDARAMAEVLRNVGFEVVEGTNLTHDAMTERLLEFGRKTQGADVVLFFYAGYGIAISGTNYLLPIDADIKSEMDVKLGAAINVDVALDQTMGDAKVKLVFLDACRDNPFTAKIKSNSVTRSATVQAGLAEMKSGEGTLIAFATGPGQTALDGEIGTQSPFTRALIAHITQPGVEIQQAMTEVRAQVNEETHKSQLPWGHTNLIGAVYLNPAAAPAPGAAPASSAPAAGASPSSSSTDVELEFWRSIKGFDEPEEFNAYLTNYPNGQFRSLALARIAALERRRRGRASGERQPNPAPSLDQSLPDFPWPPPAPSTYYVLPDDLLRDRQTLGEATDAIISALERTGYVERTFFRTKPGGVALVTRLERIEPDGTHVVPDRWSVSNERYNSAAGLASFLRGLFFAEKGHYRLIVFILQDSAFVPSLEKLNETQARGLINRGANILPAKARQQSFDGNHCTVLVYEFASDGAAVSPVKQSRLTAKEHLEKAGVLAILGKAN
jgi:hypothetical protein